MQFIRPPRLVRRRFISRRPYACAQRPGAPSEGWRPNADERGPFCSTVGRPARSSYLSLLCRISPPLFHRVTAGGEAWGLHSRVTWLPERAFSTGFNGLLVKVGGAALGWTR